MGVVGSISIRDNASSVLKNVRKEQSALRREAADTRKELQRTWDRKYTARLDTSSAVKKADSLTGKVKRLGKRIASPVIRVKDDASRKISKITGSLKAVGKRTVSPVIRVKDAASVKIKKIKSAIKGVAKKVTTPVIKIKDSATAKISKVTSKLKAIGGKTFTSVIKLKDAATKGISAISSKVKKLAKATVIPVTAAVTIGTAALAGAVSGGMKLENQQVSIEHFIGATNKDMGAEQIRAASNQYMEALRANSNATPFETGEVIQAGTRAVSVTGGDTDSAMELVKLAEDMAAASGGTKSLSDAMEALADAKLGEMERLKEFGFKISAEEFDAKGFEGVSADLKDFFGGAAGKLAETGSGLVSTIKGKLKSSVSDIGLGIVEKLKPTLNKAISLLDKAQPGFEKFGAAIADGIGRGIDVAASVLPVFVSGLKSIAPVFSTLTSGFAPMIPQLAEFGKSVVLTMQSVSSACMPALTSIISTVQTMLPAILPAAQMIISTFGNIISQAAPVISGLASGIGTAVSTLAPVIGTVFSGIGEKIGSVLSFIGERTGFIQEIIATAAPMIGDIISTAWGVISPIVDIAVSAFKILFSIVQKVFPGIQKILQTVWGIIKPIVEGIGSAVGKIAGWFGSVADAITGSGSGGDTDSVGKNATGDNNWKGGLTWVGEKGAELVDLPRGSRILPHKESVSLTGGGGVVRSSTSNVTQNTVISDGGQDMTPVVTVLTSIDSGLKILVDRFRGRESGLEVPGSGTAKGKISGFAGGITVKIAKLADQIIVREDGDIDEIADRVAKKVIEVVANMG